MRFPTHPAWLFVLALAGCSTDRPGVDLFGSSDAGLPVVDAILVVDRLFPPIFVSRTVDLAAPIHPATVGELNARVLITTDSEVFEYTETVAGRYEPTRVWVVEPETEYHLTVVTERGERLTGTTVTPQSLSIPEWLLLDESSLEPLRELADFSTGDAVYTAEENQLPYASGLLEARFARPDVSAFQVAIFSLDEGSDFVIDPDFFDEEDFEQLDRVNHSPPLTGVDGSLRLPWFAIFFEGRYKVKIFSLDDNWYDLIRSSPELGAGGPGFGGNAGDQFERPLYSIDGGIGVFGSAAVDSIGFNVLPRD